MGWYARNALHSCRSFWTISSVIRSLDFLNFGQGAPLENTDEHRKFPKRLLNGCLLFGAALFVCVVGVGAFVFADLHHHSPTGVFLSFTSVGFFAFAWEEYRKEFRSMRFCLFVCAWVGINAAVVVTVLGAFGWPLLIAALLIEQFLFYMSAYWIFGLEPPFRRR